MTEEPDPWRDVDQFIRYDAQTCRWHYLVPRPYELSPIVGSSDFRAEARRTVADLVRDKGPARVVRARGRFVRE